MLNQDVPLWLFFLLGLVCTGAGGAIIYFARKATARDRSLMQSDVQLTGDRDPAKPDGH